MHLELSQRLIHTRLTAFAIAVLGFSRPLTAQATDVAARIRQIAGCYTTHLGEWSGPLPATGLPTAHTPPPRLELDTFPVSVGSAWFAVQPARLVKQSRANAEWTLLPHDSIRLGWSTGFVGVSLRLGVRGDSLVGIAHTFHDAHYYGEPPDPSVEVIATRTDCRSTNGTRIRTPQ